MSNLKTVIADIELKKDPKRAESSARYFQAFPGGYGEGDKFAGVAVPDQRAIAKKHYKEISLKEVERMLLSSIHEHRLVALMIMVLKFQKADENLKKEIVQAYLANTRCINNWDLVDTSAEKIIGAYLYDKDRKGLLKLAKSKSVWEQRIAIIATLYFIKKLDFEWTFRIAEMYLDHKHDLIHKATGWMLREVGEKDEKAEQKFLNEHYMKMPRTMLRYAIEKFEEKIRQKYLKGEI